MKIIYYNEKVLSKIVLITDKNQKGHNEPFLFLEMNLTLFLNEKVNKKIWFQTVDENFKLVYQDFSLQIFQKWEDKIYLETGEKNALELNYFEYLMTQIGNFDSEIKQIEMIDFYQNQKCTFRVWKEKKVTDPKKDRFLFLELEKKIKRLKNVKILENKN